MSEIKKENKHGYLWGVLNHKCSRCRTGNMFQEKNSYRLKNFMKMNTYCPDCGQRMEIEVGFYYGTGYVSYVLSVMLSAATFVAWWLFIGISLTDNRFFWWIGFNMITLIVAQPYMMRLSRAVWLSFFVKYNPRWRNEKPDSSHG